VVAIVGILAGLAVVNMSGATERARIVKSQNFSAGIQHIMASNWIGQWNFNDQTANDSSGNNNNGTLSGGAAYSTSTPSGNGIAGQYSLSLDGTSGYVNCGSGTSFNNMEKFTLTAWINMNERKYIPTILNKGPESTVQHFWWGIVNTNTIFFEVGDSTGSVQLASNVLSWDLGRWYFVAVTLDNEAKEVRHYRDGTYINKRTFAGRSFDSGTYALNIGRYYNGASPTNYHFNGLIDEVHIYNSALTASAIRDQYVAGLDKLLANGQITEQDYQQRLADLNLNYAINE
jgi:hypothetical protein